MIRRLFAEVRDAIGATLVFAGVRVMTDDGRATLTRLIEEAHEEIQERER